eukprot:Nk52_evm7s168 gene=Nk52_evmTU7s168
MKLQLLKSSVFLPALLCAILFAIVVNAKSNNNINLDLSHSTLANHQGPVVDGVATKTVPRRDFVKSFPDCFVPAVMAPLNLGTLTADYNQLVNDLKQLKSDAGVISITTDVWWGQVQAKGPDSFDWGVYTTFAYAMRDAGLEWVPIMSTHQCGGNVNDDCDVSIPGFVYPRTTEELQERAFGYRKSRGAPLEFIAESLAPWYKEAIPLYKKFYENFASAFAQFKNIIPEIYLSFGPAGEARYPSYNTNTSWHYPDVGYLMAYSNGATKSFQDYAIAKYHGNLTDFNIKIMPLDSFANLNPPEDPVKMFTDNNKDVCDGPCWKTPYADLFLSWYQDELVKHINDMTSVAKAALAGLDVNLMGKVAGIHWKHNTNQGPLAAMAAGYYYQDYSIIGKAFKDNGLGMAFTCLELSKDMSHHRDSHPQALVKTVAQKMNQLGVPLFGENALPMKNDGPKFGLVKDNLNAYKFNGFTFLRWNDIVGSDNWNTRSLFKSNIVSNRNVCKAH